MHGLVTFNLFSDRVLSLPALCDPPLYLSGRRSNLQYCSSNVPPPPPAPQQTVVLEQVRQALRIPSSNHVCATYPRRQHDRYPVGGKIKIGMNAMHRML